MTTIEFFHDAVCGWCYLLSPRLRKIAEKYPVRIVHRTFVLQHNEQEMIARFGSLSNAKQEILQHWKQCQLFSENPELINVERMRIAPFDYPTGYLAALYAKAIEQLCGQQAHWDFFDAVQRAHLYEARNIADAQVLNEIAKAQGFVNAELFTKLCSPCIKQAVMKDKLRAKDFGIHTIPSLVVNGKKVVSQTLSLAQLEQLISTNETDQYAEEKL
ncbi:DsbA family protein [Alteromonas sediminis]|uniref:DsbA family protein n=1 Tax=Alteromonas sediminis TaxID=2259342 RepID=A0A3N5ZBI9_9ALTE|nr:DsbA family protein [Alteromonas sediminis]RPJ66968.1 DsbA family protein [Alteromonas sediminis]